MRQEDSEQNPEESRLQELLAEWLERLEAGDIVAPEELCSDDPHMAARLAALIERTEENEDLLGALRPSPPARDESGEWVGDYKLLQLLGRGAMGEVYVAEEQPLGRRVALKLLRPRVHRDPRLRLRFDREARVTAALEHPNIVPVYAVGTEGDRDWMAMKLVEGPTLDALPKPVDAERVASIGAAVAHALHEAHVSGVLHRDVKPANIILEGDTPVLVDFGLARTLEDITGSSEGAVVGTLLYMSPEQLRAEVNLDGRTDVYSLGVTLYEALTGYAPFDGETPESIIRQVLLKDPPMIRLSGRHRDLETIIFKACEKERDRRYASAGEMAEDLQRFLDQRPIKARRSSVFDRSWKRIRRHPRAAAAVGAACLVAITLAVLLISNLMEQRERRDQAIEDVHRSLRAGRLREAARRLEQLDDRADERVETARLRLVALQTFEKLYDVILDRELYQSAARTRSLLAAAEEHMDVLGNHAPFKRARPIALWRAGDRERARELLDSMPHSRARVALSAAFGGRDLLEALDTAPNGTDADDHLFSALALDIADHPAEVVLVETERAMQLAPTHRQVRLLHGRLLGYAGDYVAALEAFRAMVGEDDERPAVMQGAAISALRTNQLALANAYLNMLPEVDRDLGWHINRAEFLLRRGEPERAREVIRLATERWPERADAHFRAGYFALETGRPASEVSEHFERAVALSPAPDIRYWCEAWEINLELQGARGAATIRELLEDIRSLRRSSRGGPRSRAQAWYLEALMHRALRDDAAFLAAMRESLEISNELEYVKIELALFACEGWLTEWSGGAKATTLSTGAIELARTLMYDLVDRTGEGVSHQRTSQTADALFYGAVLAAATKDETRFTRLSSRYVLEAPDPDGAVTTQRRRILDALRESLKK